LGRGALVDLQVGFGLTNSAPKYQVILSSTYRFGAVMLPTIEQAEITSNPRALKCCAASEVRFALDSPLEGTGFEPSVPPDRSSRGTYPADVRSDAPTLFSSGARRRLPLESDRRPLPDPATSFANSRYFRPVHPKKPASTSGTRSSNPLSSSGESETNRATAQGEKPLIAFLEPPPRAQSRVAEAGSSRRCSRIRGELATGAVVD
jgi:hypothetical protein